MAPTMQLWAAGKEKRLAGAYLLSPTPVNEVSSTKNERFGVVIRKVTSLTTKAQMIARSSEVLLFVKEEVIVNQHQKWARLGRHKAVLTLLDIDVVRVTHPRPRCSITTYTDAFEVNLLEYTNMSVSRYSSIAGLPKAKAWQIMLQIADGAIWVQQQNPDLLLQIMPENVVIVPHGSGRPCAMLAGFAASSGSARIGSLPDPRIKALNGNQSASSGACHAKSPVHELVATMIVAMNVKESLHAYQLLVKADDELMALMKRMDCEFLNSLAVAKQSAAFNHVEAERSYRAHPNTQRLESRIQSVTQILEARVKEVDHAIDEANSNDDLIKALQCHSNNMRSPPYHHFIDGRECEDCHYVFTAFPVSPLDLSHQRRCNMVSLHNRLTTLAATKRDWIADTSFKDPPRRTF